MLQFFDTLTDDSGNSLLGGTVQVLNWPSLTNATIYSTNGTANPIANNTVSADVTGQVSFYAPDGAYQLVYAYKGTTYKTRAPYQLLDPMGFVAATDTGTANNYAVTDSRFPAQLYAGLKFEFKAANTSTGPSTLNLNASGAKNILLPGGAALASGVIQLNGLYRLEYDGTQWQLVAYVGPPFYGTTGTETGLGITPSNFSYPVDPYVDPRRYGADPLGVVDATTAVQTALNVAYALKSAVWIGASCNFLVGALTLTLTGNQTNDGIRILGSSTGGSKLTANGTPAAVLTFIGSAPAGSPQPAPVVLENFSILISGGNTTTDGVLFKGVAYFSVKKVYIPSGGAHCINLQSALSGTIEDCYLGNALYGVFCRTFSTGSGCNVIRIVGGTISGNTTYGIDYDGSASGAGASMLICRDIDMEANVTGAIHIGANIAHSLGFSTIVLDKLWLETNGLSVQVDSPASGQTFIAIRDCATLAETNLANAINIAGAQYLLIENTNSPSTGATWNLTATYARLLNCLPYSLGTVALTYPHFEAVSTNSTNYYNGYFTAAGTVLTLTGCSTAPTQNVNIIQQDADVVIEFQSSLTATSNATTMTLTGLPAAYQPSFNQNFAAPVINNAVNTVVNCEVDAASGTITFDFTFTASGLKGIPPNTAIRYRLKG